MDSNLYMVMFSLLCLIICSPFCHRSQAHMALICLFSATQEGDVLYMPRGTIHQAVAQSADCVHLTISTYQRWTHGDLAMRILGKALVDADPSGADSPAGTHPCLMPQHWSVAQHVYGAVTGHPFLFRRWWCVHNIKRSCYSQLRV